MRSAELTLSITWNPHQRRVPPPGRMILTPIPREQLADILDRFMDGMDVLSDRFPELRFGGAALPRRTAPPEERPSVIGCAIAADKFTLMCRRPKRSPASGRMIYAQFCTSAAHLGAAHVEHPAHNDRGALHGTRPRKDP